MFFASFFENVASDMVVPAKARGSTTYVTLLPVTAWLNGFVTALTQG